MSKMKVGFFISLLLIVAFVAPTFAQEDITLRWRTRPDNQAAADVYSAAGDTIDAAWDGVSLEYEPGGPGRSQNHALSTGHNQSLYGETIGRVAEFNSRKARATVRPGGSRCPQANATSVRIP